MNKNTEKIILIKFNKEFTTILQKILNNDVISKYIDSFVFSKLFIELGCANASDMQNDLSIEFKKVEEIWKYL